MDPVSGWLPLRRVPSLFSFEKFQTLLLVLSGAAALLFLLQAFHFLPVTGENVYPESAGVLAAQRWSHGDRLYGDYRQPPYLVTPFPPVWYALLALGTKLGLLDLDSLTLFGRALSLASLFGAVGLGYLWNRRSGLSRPLSLLAPTFYLSFPILIPWAVTARPDFLALFIGFAALYWIGFRRSVVSVGAAALFAATAFLVRHNAVAVPVAAVLWLLWCKRWKHASLFCAVWFLVVGTTLLALQLSSHGLLLLNLSGAKFGQFALTYVRDILSRLLAAPGHGFATALFAFGALGMPESYRRKDQPIGLLGIYLVVALALAVLGSAAAGAAVNYYLEPALAMAVLAPTAVGRLQGAWRSDSPLASFAFVVILVLLLPSLDSQRSNLKHDRPEDLRRVGVLMENRQVFTDIPYLAARTPRPEALDLASLMNAERAGGSARWSSNGLTRSLLNKKYDLVVLVEPVDEWPYDPVALYPRWPRLDSAIQMAIRQSYHFCFELDASYIYSPRSTDDWSGGSNCPLFPAPISTLESHSEILSFKQVN